MNGQLKKPSAEPGCIFSNSEAQPDTTIIGTSDISRTPRMNSMPSIGRFVPFVMTTSAGVAMRRILAEVLERAGHQVITFAHGAEALEESQV
jgi:hypothetical protein